MAKYECRICGYEFDEQQAGESFENLYSCPICDADKSSFKLVEGEVEEGTEEKQEEAETEDFVFEDAESEKVEDTVAEEEEKTDETNTEESVEEPEEERETFEEFLRKIEAQTEEELKAAEAVSQEEEKTVEEEKREAVYESIFSAKTDFPEDTSEKDFIDEILEANEEEKASGFTIEKRQEFWKSAESDEAQPEETKEETPAVHNYSGLSHLGSVQKVIGGENVDTEAESKTEEKAPENNGLIQTFYSFSKPVKTEEELKAEEEARAEKENAAFKPFFGSGMGTIQKVVGAPAKEEEKEEFVFEEYKNEEPVENNTEEAVMKSTEEAVDEVAENVAEEAVEETTESIFEEAPEETIEETTETILEETPEEVVEEATETILEEMPEEVVEEATEAIFEEAPEEAVEEATEAILEEAPEETVEETTEAIFEEAPEELAEETADTIFEEIPVEETVETTEDVTEDLSDTVFEELTTEEDSIAALFEDATTEEAAEETMDGIFEETPQEDITEEIFEEAPVEEALEENTVEAPTEVMDALFEEIPVEETEEISEDVTGENEEVISDDATEEVADDTSEENVEETAEEDDFFFEEFVEETPATQESVEEVVETTEDAGSTMDDEGVVFFNFGEENAEAETTGEAENIDIDFSDETPDQVAEESTEDIVGGTVEEVAEEMIDEVEETTEEVTEEVAEETVEEIQTEEIVDDTLEAEPIDEEAVEYINFDNIFDNPEDAPEVAEETADVEETVADETGDVEIPFVAVINNETETTEEAKEEAEERDYICLDEQGEQVPETEIAYSMLKSEMKYTVLYDEEAKKIFDDYPVMNENVSNGLENIILLPAQCNPLPLRRNEPVETRTVIGALTECPVEVLQPFCFSKLFLWGEHIPNNTRAEEYNNQALILVKGEEGHIPNLSSKEELKEEVEIAKARYHGTPVGIDLVAGRIEADLEACVYAKVDFVILNDVSSRILPYALRRARNYLNRVNSKLEILVCVEALKDAQELAKILALGANFVLVERGFDLNMANDMTEALKEICRSTGHDNVHDLNLDDICTVDMDIAMYTDISHV